VHPVEAIKDFNYLDAKGALEVELAPFGRFQTGTTIQAPLYYPPVGLNGCTDMTPPEHIADKYNMHWKGFVIV